MLKITIKTNIIVIVSFLVILSSAILLYSQYYFGQKQAVETVHKTVVRINDNIQKTLLDEVVFINNLLNINKQNQGFLQTINFNPLHPVFDELINILRVKKQIYAVYFSKPDGEFYEIINMQNNPGLYKAFNAPGETLWTIITVINKQKQTVYLDESLNIINKKINTTDYDPRQRPWYLDAMKSDGVISTSPYMFANTDSVGMTYAVKLPDQQGAIFGLDLTLDQLNKSFSMQAGEEYIDIFLMSKEGIKYASSEFYGNKSVQHTDFNKVDEALIEELKNNNTNVVLKYKDNGKLKYSVIERIENSDLYLGIKLDAETLLNPLYENIKYSLAVSLLLLLFMIPIVYISINFIVRPIKDLIIENEKIKNRQFEQVKKIKTRIIEFDELADSQVELSHSIQQYEISQESFLDALIKLIAEAIDAKSTYTGGHCKRVPEIAKSLLDVVNNTNEGVFKDFSLLSKVELREFEIGAWLHDCGKVTSPEYVIDKSTKLETINNRIHEIRTRFEVLWRDAEIEFLQNKISSQALDEKKEILQQDFTFLAETNIGGEFISDENIERVKKISSQEWIRNFDNTLGLSDEELARYLKSGTEELPVKENLLVDGSHHLIERENFDKDKYEAEGFKLNVPEFLHNIGEIYNLSIKKGTLNDEERFIVNEHVIMTIKMLNKIPFPGDLKNIPEYAGTHHETLIGTGYPKRLSKEDLSVPARIMAIADIFEALTASDRPYKKAKTLSESIKIMSFMVKDQHIDKDLFELFLRSGIYKTYGEEYLDKSQIDKVIIEDYLA